MSEQDDDPTAGGPALTLEQVRERYPEIWDRAEQAAKRVGEVAITPERAHHVMTKQGELTPDESADLWRVVGAEHRAEAAFLAGMRERADETKALLEDSRGMFARRACTEGESYGEKVTRKRCSMRSERDAPYEANPVAIPRGPFNPDAPSPTPVKCEGCENMTTTGMCASCAMNAEEAP